MQYSKVQNYAVLYSTGLGVFLRIATWALLTRGITVLYSTVLLQAPGLCSPHHAVFVFVHCSLCSLSGEPGSTHSGHAGKIPTTQDPPALRSAWICIDPRACFRAFRLPASRNLTDVFLPGARCRGL